MSNTRLELFPLTVRVPAPGPVMVKLSEICSSPLASVMVEPTLVVSNVMVLPALLPYGRGPGKQDIVHPLDEPLKRVGHIRILRGSLAPAGSVAKITGKEGTRFSGPARVFDSEEAMIQSARRSIRGHTICS